MKNYPSRNLRPNWTYLFSRAVDRWKFICFLLPDTSYRDVHAIRKRLLRSTILKRSREQKTLEQNLCKVENILISTLNSFDWLILSRCLRKNIEKRIHKIIATHQKNLRNLSKNTTLPLSHKETVTNLSSHKLTDDELDILKNGQDFSIRPARRNKTDVLASFEMIHQTMKRNLRNYDQTANLKTEIAHLAQNYVSSYKPTSTDLKKHRILRNIRNNREIIVLKPDKGNGVVITDR